MIRLPSFCKFINLYRTDNASISGIKQITTGAFPLQFKASPALWAEPLKKKKRLDPALIKAREERKKKRIEKEIRRLKKVGRQLKPLVEIEIPQCLVDEKERKKRVRNEIIPKDVAEERIKLAKEWAKATYYAKKSDAEMLDRLLFAQQKALDELKLESEELYQAAVQIDSKLIPFKFTGPCETPINADYSGPDGEYFDESKKWV